MAIGNAYGLPLSLAHVRTFLAVAEAGSFSEAALALDVSQASVSAAVKRGEAALGVTLFRRGAYGARLTDEGHRLVEPALRLLRAEETLRQQARLANGELQGTVRVAAFPSIARYALPLVMQRLAERYSGVALAPVDVDANSQEVVATVDAGRAELGLVVARLSEAHFHWKLFDDAFAVCVPVARASAEPTWEDLRDLPLIAYDKDWRDGCVAGMQEVMDRFSVTPHYRIRDTGVILGMIERGLGFSVLPGLALGTLPAGVARLTLPVRATRTVFAAVPPDLFATPTVRATLSVLAEAFPDSEVPPVRVQATVDAA